MNRIPLALLPGTLCTGLLWEHQVAALQDIADPHIFDVAQHNTLKDLARYIHTAMPAPFAVAGLSYGGIIAFEVWRQNPAAVSHIALLNTTPMPATPAKHAAQQALVQMALDGNFREVTTDHLKDTMLHPDNQKNLPMRKKVLQMAEDVGMQGFINQITAQLARPDSRPTLKTLDCPTLILTGDADRLCTPQIHHDMAARVPHATLHIIENCGHLSTMEQPEVISNELRQWLLQPTPNRKVIS